MDGAREKIAELLGAGFREIIFTASATEANNLALRGTLKAIMQNAKVKSQNYNSKHKSKLAQQGADPLSFDFCDLSFRPRILVSAIEHESILETARDLERSGIEAVYLPVDKSGKVSLNKLKQALNERTILISVMYANNELGAVQPIAEISNIVRNFKKLKLQNPNSKYPLVHTDAVQAFQYLDCDVNRLGIDMMTLSGHKIYGPKGIGIIYVRNPLLTTNCLLPIITGGGQEFGLRSGTENVPFIVGMAEAIELAAKARKKEAKRISCLRDYLLRGLKKIYPKVEVNGSPDLPNILNLYFPDYPANELVTRLDIMGIAVGTGSACASRTPEASHVLRALGFSEMRAKRSIRISLGRPVSKTQIDIFLKRAKNLFV